MSVKIGEQEYFNQEEAIAFLNKRGIAFSSPLTFKSLRERYEIKGINITGQGRALFYKPEDLEKIPVIQTNE